MTMDAQFIGFTIEVIGKLMIGFTAIAVHHRFLKERKVDARVFKSMRREQIIGMLGMFLIVAGYFMQIPSLI
jgi:hypothetical protein